MPLSIQTGTQCGKSWVDFQAEGDKEENSKEQQSCLINLEEKRWDSNYISASENLIFYLEIKTIMVEGNHLNCPK